MHLRLSFALNDSLLTYFIFTFKSQFSSLKTKLLSPYTYAFKSAETKSLSTDNNKGFYE